MGLFGDVLDFAGTAIGIFGDLKGSDDAEDIAKDQKKAVKEAAKWNRKLSLHDAAIAEQEAIEAFIVTQRNLQLHFRMADALLGQQKTRLAKGGVVVSEGTPADLMRQTSIRLREDAAIIEYEGKKAQQQREKLAERYRMMAEAKFRDAANAANLIEKTGQYESFNYRLSAIERGISYLGRIY